MKREKRYVKNNVPWNDNPSGKIKNTATTKTTPTSSRASSLAAQTESTT